MLLSTSDRMPPEQDEFLAVYGVARSLLVGLCQTDPITHSHEGLDDGCLFCGADCFSTCVDRGTENSVSWAWKHGAEHDEDCLWVKAHNFFDSDLPAPHLTKKKQGGQPVMMSAKEIANLYQVGNREHSWGAELYELQHHGRWSPLVQSILRDGYRDDGEGRRILIGPDGRVWDGHHRICAMLVLDPSLPLQVDVIDQTEEGRL